MPGSEELEVADGVIVNSSPLIQTEESNLGDSPKHYRLASVGVVSVPG